MKWSEAVREEPVKIWEVWDENSSRSSYWSTEDKALIEISKLSGIPKEQLEFKKYPVSAWLITKDGEEMDPGIAISEIEVDTGKYH